jgi:hypothetical protein
LACHFHHEGDGAATGAATEAMVKVFGGIYFKRRGLFRMERAEAPPGTADRLKIDETADQVHEIDLTTDIVYDMRWVFQRYTYPY